MSTINVIYYGSLDEYVSETYEVTLPRGRAVPIPETVATKLTTVRRGQPREFFIADSLDQIPEAIRKQRDEEYRTYPDRVIKDMRAHAKAFEREAERCPHDDERVKEMWRKGAMEEVAVAEDAVYQHQVLKAERQGLNPPPPKEEVFGESDDDFGETAAPKRRGRSKAAVA